MGKDHIQVPLDHTGLFVGDMIDLIAKLKETLKPKTEIPALHLSPSIGFQTRSAL